MAKQTNWWDKLGEPRYGGELVIRANIDITDFDPYSAVMGNIHSAWMERLVADDWTLDPAVFDFKSHWRPAQYTKGQLLESWEFTDPVTYVGHLRKGIYWQPFLNHPSREFTAEDVAFHFNRFCGLAEFKQPSPLCSGIFKDLLSATAKDKYTVVLKWKPSSPAAIIETLHLVSPTHCIENPEVVKVNGDLNDWHLANGTGPFALKDFVPGKSARLEKNQNYWAHDERHPQNKLPYLDSVKFLVVTDEAEAINLMREGKIDIIDHISPTEAYALKKTNPEILLITHPDSNAASIEPRNDVRPFNDIRVRTALQMAIDLKKIAKIYYHGLVDPYPVSLTSRYMHGWGFPYEQWPDDLRLEYAYNPQKAKKLLAEAGYPNGFKTNVVVEATSDIGMLEMVKADLAAVGVDMELRLLAPEEWSSFVRNGHKHDQMAHCISGPLGHSSSPLHDLTRFQKGSWANYMMVDDRKVDNFLVKATAAKTIEETKEITREANEYISRRHFTISLLQPMAYSLCQPSVKGFDGQFGSAWAHSAGPAMLSFYLARFWLEGEPK